MKNQGRSIVRLPRFLSKLIPNFKIKDVKEWLDKGHIDIYLEQDKDAALLCSRCNTKLTRVTGSYFVRVKEMPIFNYHVFLIFKRKKGECPSCKKIRAQKLEFISNETPHLTKQYSWWLSRMCEIAPVSNVGKITGIDKSTLWRLDFARLRRLLQNYKIPNVKRISVDEVYARKKSYGKRESRDKRFFTIICDLDTRRVIWVSESREKAALDEFFHIIGPERCKKIEVVAMDQHDSYKKSVEDHCPTATVIWDRFHVMQIFNNAVDDDRRWLHQYMCHGEDKRLTRGKFKRLFVKKSSKRTREETRHINDVLKDNEHFAYLELIKEGMHQLYQSTNEYDAKEKFHQIGAWIRQSEYFYSLRRWWDNFEKSWSTFKNYFYYPVSSSLSEGQNNAIKALKRRAFGYKDMTYFKLKILQVCGFLNTRYVPMEF